MIGRLFVSLILFFNLGCATLTSFSPKETVKAIFTEVENHNYQKAQQIFDQSPNATGFEVYEGGGAAFGKVSADDIQQLLGVGTSYMTTCEGLVKQAKEFSSGDNNDENESQLTSLADLKDQFKSECEFQQKEYLKEELIKIKKYSTVDLLASAPALKKAFYSEIKKIESAKATKKNVLAQIKQAELEKQEAYENSQEFYLKKLCEMDDRVKLGRTVIDRENEAGKNSGFVDKKKLYEAGKVIQINEGRIKHFSSEYKSKFGKSWNASECK